MPSVAVCLWNLQNYGSGFVDRKWGADSGLRNRFIRAFVRQQGLDVLLMMEPGAFSEGSLRSLARWLNGDVPAADADWCVSLCGSALAAETTPNPPRTVFDLTFLTDARSEGYAVAWRSNRPTFRVLPGLHPIAPVPVSSVRNPAPPAETPLNLTTRGRPTGRYDVVQPAEGRKRARSVTVFGALGGYRQPRRYPFDERGDEMDHWPELRFPTTSTRNPSQLRMQKARRPAYVVLDLANGGTAQQRLTPAAVYHAPSNAAKAELGSMMAGLSRELYVTNDVAAGAPNPAALVSCDHTILGGDFNYSVAAERWPAYYAFLVGPFRVNRSGGANTRPAPPPASPDPDRRTTVQLLRDEHTTPIVSADVDDYLFHKIDLVFTRGGGSSGRRVNVLRLLLDDAAGVYRGSLRALHAHLTALVAGLNPLTQRMAADGRGPEEHRSVQDAAGRWSLAWRPMLCGSWGGTFVSWDAFMAQLQDGRFTDARQAAEFYHIFVSDHLPLVATLAW